MKTKKIIALMLSLAMVLGVVACSNNGAEETTTAAPAPTEAAPTEDGGDATVEETQDAAVDESAYVELEVADVADEDGATLVAWSFNTEFGSLIDAYWGGEYEYQQQDQDSYQTKLDQVLASGEDCPDVFACDADYAGRYMNSSNTLAINDLGIAYSECSEMYNYTLQFACDDNSIIKGLAWQACPCGVFYNRTMADEIFGVSEPEDVAPLFESWEAFLETARTVNEASNGEKKAIAGENDVYRAYLNTRTQGWITNGEITVDPIMNDYFDFAKALKDEDLTFEAVMWQDAWNAAMTDYTVLSYWGPMWLGKYSMGLGNDDDGDGEYDNPTSGEWGLVNAPASFYWGGTWMMASKYCDTKASVADLMRGIAINEDNLRDNALKGEFVNSIAIMTEMASDDAYAIDWLGGQNPAAVLLASASTIDNSIITDNDSIINDEFTSVVASYLTGDIETPAEAIDTFTANLEELNVI